MSDAICKIPTCVTKVYAKGWCSVHYQRARKSGGNPLAETPTRFIAPHGSKSPVCLIAGCLAPESRRGWCIAHYTRWIRHGDPLGGRVAEGEAEAYFLATVGREQDECLVWPYGTTRMGYGRFQTDNHRYLVHVLACERAHGPRPLGLQASHGPCHKRLCYNGRHLSWETPSENTLNKYRDGTMLHGEQIAQAKLTEEDVLEIRARRASGESRVLLADEFDVHPEHIGAICAGKHWRHLL